MNHFYNPDEQTRVTAARESFSGRLLTDSQFEDAIAITGVIEREIQKTGRFKEKLSDYAVAMARTEKFDVMKSENIIRDLFKLRKGQSMNDLREQLMNREQNLTPDETQDAYVYAQEIGTMIKEGNKIPFHRAYAHQATALASELGITDAGAKSLMNEAFKIQEGRELYDWGKEHEEKYYRPQIEAEKQQRQADQPRSRSMQRPR